MSTRNDLEFSQGDDTQITLQATRLGAPASLAGKRMELLVKPKAESDDVDQLFQLSSVGPAGIVITDAPNGLAVATLTDLLDDDGEFWYRAWIAAVADATVDRETFTHGLWVVKPR